MPLPPQDGVSRSFLDFEDLALIDPRELTVRQRERRQGIIDAAVAAASAGGYRHVHMRDIAERAGVSMATLYHYFPSKVHLLMTALGDELADFDDQVQFEMKSVRGPFHRLQFAVGRLIHVMEHSSRMTEALTHAYAASHVAASQQARAVHSQTSRMFADLMVDGTPGVGFHEVAEILSDVWTSGMLALVQERRTFDDLRMQLSATIDVLAKASGGAHHPRRL